MIHADPAQGIGMKGCHRGLAGGPEGTVFPGWSGEEEFGGSKQSGSSRLFRHGPLVRPRINQVATTTYKIVATY